MHIKRTFGWLSPVLLLAATTLACSAPGDDAAITDDGAEIVSGTTEKIENVPWQVLLLDPDQQPFCGGSIIDKRWILTAQHCAEAMYRGVIVVAGIDDYQQQDGVQAAAADNAFTYPGYVDATFGKDVLLLHLDRDLDLSGAKAKAIALATEDEEADGLTKPGVEGHVSGWGQTRDGDYNSLPSKLQATDVTIVSNDDARAAYLRVYGNPYGGSRNSIVTDDQLAAGGNGRDTCQGDSGGPFVVKSKGKSVLAGVVSWGGRCGEIGVPGFYARVSSFRSWIEKTIEENPTGGVEPKDDGEGGGSR